jgi:hypothetical protein
LSFFTALMCTTSRNFRRATVKLKALKKAIWSRSERRRCPAPNSLPAPASGLEPQFKQGGGKSSLFTTLMCTTSRQIPASVSQKQGLEKDDLIPL